MKYFNIDYMEKNELFHTDDEKESEIYMHAISPKYLL